MIIQWSQPTRHFIGMCDTCVGGTNVHPVVYVKAQVSVTEIQSFLATGGQLASNMNSYVDGPVYHSVFWFNNLQDISEKKIINAELNLECGSTSTSSESSVTVLSKVLDSPDAPSPSLTADYSLFSFAASSSHSLDTTSPVGEVYTLSMTSLFQTRADAGLSGLGGVGIAIESSVGSEEVSYQLAWESATLEIEYYG